jgi:cysteinyl-tRNA synthetase
MNNLIHTTKTGKMISEVMDIILKQRMEYRNKKNYIKSDEIRKDLENIGFKIKDESNNGTSWSINLY